MLAVTVVVVATVFVAAAAAVVCTVKLSGLALYCMYTKYIASEIVQPIYFHECCCWSEMLFGFPFGYVAFLLPLLLPLAYAIVVAICPKHRASSRCIFDIFSVCFLSLSLSLSFSVLCPCPLHVSLCLRSLRSPSPSDTCT